MKLYKNLRNIAKLVQEYIKRYYNKKRSKGPALKEGDKVQLLHKKLDYIKLGLFKIIKKILEVIY